MKRLFALALVLSFLLPACFPNSGFAAPATGGAQVANAHVAGDVVQSPETHCPAEAPADPACTTLAEPALNAASLAPRPDTGGLFGAVPAPRPGTAQLPRPQDHPSPDLQQLSITRI